jgi:hypothetical protein
VSHEFDLVRVRVDRLHHRSMAINGRLERAERRYRETGDLEPAGSRPSTSNLESGESVADGAKTALRNAGLEPYNELPDVPAADAAFAGDVGGSGSSTSNLGGSLQSCVVE